MCIRDSPDIGIRFRSVLPRLPGNDIDREKGTGLFLQNPQVAGNEFIHLPTVPAIANARPKDDLVEWFQVHIRLVIQRQQRDLMILLFDNLLQPLANHAGVTIGAGVDE